MSPFLRRRADDLQVDPALLAALTAPATEAELAGETSARVAFRTTTTVPASHRRRPAWRPAVLSTLLASKLTTALAAGAVGLSGAAAAAYTGSLPDTAQDVAHNTIHAPAAKHHAKPSTAPSATPVGPDATGPAAYGLCTAFDKERTHGKAAEKSIAYRNLATAAGGADKIAAYCATVPKPSDSPAAGSGKPSTHPTGKPASVPAHATGKPATVPPAH